MVQWIDEQKVVGENSLRDTESDSLNTLGTRQQWPPFTHCTKIFNILWLNIKQY